MMTHWKRHETWLAGGAVGIACVAWQFRLRFPFDDTFISFRYAEHLATGSGLVWNIGGPQTEGYTNFLFVLLLALARYVTSDLLAVSQLIGLAASVATGVVIYKIAARLRDANTGLVAALIYFLAPLTWINALSGMETSLFVLLVVLALLFFAQDRLVAAFSIVFLATLTRPEGALLAGSILVTAWNRTDRSYRTDVSAALFCFVLPVMAYAVWKLWYFGSLLPNSFYLKVSDSAKLLPGLQYVRLFAMSALALVIASFGIRLWRARPVIVVAALWNISLLVFYLFVNPLEGLYDRFLWPAFAGLCVTAAVGLSDLSERLHIRALPWAILLLQAILTVRSPRTAQSLAAHEEVWDASMDHIVTELRLLPHADSLTLAYGDAGYVVYKSGIRHLDLFGLNDSRIARVRARDERAAIIRSERPDLLLLPITDSNGKTALVEDAYGVVKDSTFRGVASFSAFPYKLVLLLNSQSPRYLECCAAISARMQTTGNFYQPAPNLNQLTR